MIFQKFNIGNTKDMTEDYKRIANQYDKYKIKNQKHFQNIHLK